MRHVTQFRKRPRPRGTRAARAARVAAALAAAAALACSGGDRKASDARIAAREAAGCNTVDTAAVVKKAVAAFLDSLQPKPLRFLYMAGTDSMLPDAGQQALQDHGPTYLWPADPAKQGPVKTNLSNRGPWNALLVTWRGLSQPRPDQALVRLGATWIGPVDDGKQVGVHATRFECRAAGDSAYQWVVTSKGLEQGA